MGKGVGFSAGVPQKRRYSTRSGKILASAVNWGYRSLMDLARIVSFSKSRRPLTPGLAACVACALVQLGCAAQQGPSTPAWPEQPSPSYPDPSGQADSRPAPGNLDAEKNSAETAGASNSNLAKEYEGKEALETLNGKATYYADSLAGNHTANGDIYDPKEFTAAHKKLPFGTIVRVIRQDNGTVTYARVNDRGPFGSRDRIIDLSRAAAAELQMMRAGVVDVRVEIVDRPAK